MDYINRNGTEISINIKERIENKLLFLDQIAEDVNRCIDCDLYKFRNKIVPGHYPYNAFMQPVRIILLGEGPGAMEDVSGEVFVGKSGEVLNDLLHSIGLSRKNIFILNTVKCHCPKNRAPEPNEMFMCAYYLYRQIGTIQPDLLITLGASAIYFAIQPKQPDFTLSTRHKRLRVSDARNQIHDFTSMRVDYVPEWKCKSIATYHPAALLRSTERKKQGFADFQFINRYINILRKKKLADDI